MKKVYYLVEAFSQDLQFESEADVIALTPMACYQLEKERIRYSTLEDFHDETKILKEEKDYYKDQLAWFDKFDNFLVDFFPEAKVKNIKLATIYYFYIKNMVDAVILRSKIIASFLKKARPKSIIYVTTKWEEDSISSSEYPLLFRNCKSLYSRLMPLFCADNRIEFHYYYVKNDLYIDAPYSRFRNLPSRIKVIIKENENLRQFWYSLKTFNIRDILHFSSGRPNKNILFLHGNRIIRKIMKEARMAGYGVFFKTNNDIKQLPLGLKKVGKTAKDKIIESIGFSNGHKFTGDSIVMKWINCYCGVDVSSILMPRLQYFLYEFCPQFLDLLDKYITLYKDKEIHFVITSHMTKVDEFAAIAATKFCPNTKSICLQHGDDVFDIKMWDLSEYSPYNIYFTNIFRETISTQ